MVKKDLIRNIEKKYPKFSLSLTEEAVNLFFHIISFYLQHHQRVELRGFGSFSVRKRKKRSARNPKTGEFILVDEKWTPFFKPSIALREILKNKKINLKKPGIFSIISKNPKNPTWP